MKSTRTTKDATALLITAAAAASAGSLVHAHSAARSAMYNGRASYTNSDTEMFMRSVQQRSSHFILGKRQKKHRQKPAFATGSALQPNRIPRGGSNAHYDSDDDMYRDNYGNTNYGSNTYNNNDDGDPYYGDERSKTDNYYDDRGDYYDDRGRPSVRSHRRLCLLRFSGNPGSNCVFSFSFCAFCCFCLSLVRIMFVVALFLLQQRNGARTNPLANMELPSVVKNGNRKIGVPLLGIGAALTVLGMSLFFNKTLMRLGNLFFVAGVPMTIGPGRTAGYFFQPTKARATGCLTLGIFLVFVGWPVLGILLEAFGLLNLFGNMFPVAMAVLKTMPIIGPILRGDNNNSNKRRGGEGGGDRNDRYDYDDRDYYNEGGGDQDDSYRGYY